MTCNDLVDRLSALDFSPRDHPTADHRPQTTPGASPGPGQLRSGDVRSELVGFDCVVLKHGLCLLLGRPRALAGCLEEVPDLAVLVAHSLGDKPCSSSSE